MKTSRWHVVASICFMANISAFENISIERETLYWLHAEPAS